jgi:hypothetical protein
MINLTEKTYQDLIKNILKTGTKKESIECGSEKTKVHGCFTLKIKIR